MRVDARLSANAPEMAAWQDAQATKPAKNAIVVMYLADNTYMIGIYHHNHEHWLNADDLHHHITNDSVRYWMALTRPV
jgi:hypothetical protein